MSNIVTIYDEDGNEVRVSSLNAYDMVRIGRHFFNRNEALMKKTGSWVEPEVVEEKSATPLEEVNLFNDPLQKVADSVLGEGADIVQYLESLTKERLLQLADLRYNLRLKVSDPKQKIISMITERENNTGADED